MWQQATTWTMEGGLVGASHNTDKGGQVGTSNDTDNGRREKEMRASNMDEGAW